MPRTLFLLRHAKSNWDDPGRSDHDRPLAPRGRRACELVADYLRRERITPTLVLCSSSRRTRETFERIASGFCGDVDVDILDGLYGATATDLLARLRDVPGRAKSVMLIGHNPAIQELALGLAAGDRQEALSGKFPTAALASLSFEGDWNTLSPGSAELIAFVKPRELSSRL